MTQNLQSTIEAAWDNRAQLTATSHPEVNAAVESVIADLNAGRIRVADRQSVGQWTVNQWVKKAVLLSFRLNDNELMRSGDLTFFDKVKTKFSNCDEAEVRASGVRIVPPAVARRGSRRCPTCGAHESCLPRRKARRRCQWSPCSVRRWWPAR